MSTLENLQHRHSKSLLSKKETAKELNISQATLDRLRKSGAIKSKKVGGGVFFTINEIALFLES
ncbi:AlpA family transcriptional regulator [Malaciobacter marinus]|uniref:helix-turn-helix domain-containing protein n=1 Tax=Malaciobacter marinus TaxID=505249 RepID=UPI000C07A0CD|nr:helix-turn-helix domain-containing protein [Malaciobacter marinus]PHO11346.1 AlpA family transcriptional regulator [Malaciobacter marinus]